MSKIANSQIAEIVLAQLQAGESTDTVMTRLAAYLVQQRRTKDADYIARSLENMLQNSGGHLELQVTTARELSVELSTAIKSLFTNQSKDIVINHKVDKAVIGGALVEAPGQRLDLTVRRRLQQLALTENGTGV